ncbi:hypothetical protein Zm00014a_020726 [Zea mays]|uniref:Flowering time control protein FY n=1 Tax=Zea mays TaxID=4577 RepID=A0A3L6FF67_MAIZE|nr:Flowering time control protein FY [Zea mays]PWZ31458.1 hypothetical protein Zm00014a_020726 [Zea mays]
MMRQQQQLPPPPQHPPPQASSAGGGGGGEFYRGPPMRQLSAASSTNLPPDYAAHPAPPSQQQHQPPYDAYGDSFGAKRMRKPVQRRTVDYTSSVVRYVQARMWQRDARDRFTLQPTPAAVLDVCSFTRNICYRLSHIQTTPQQVLLPNLYIHQSIRTGALLIVSWYWQSNMNNVKVNKTAHRESVRGLSFSRTDLKFCSCSDDRTVKVWDFARCQEEKSLTGHGWDVKTVDWHPTKSLLVSGGKDYLVKLWDAKSGRELSSFHGHKNIVHCVKWNQNGNWVLTASKDQIIKLYDIRSMKELQSFRGHTKDVTALAWHPFHEEYFVSGSFDGAIFHWLVGSTYNFLCLLLSENNVSSLNLMSKLFHFFVSHEAPQIEISNAHDSSVWDLSWHPVGYLLCSGGNDHATKFWCRNRPGDLTRDRYNSGQMQGFGDQHAAFGARGMGGFQMPEPPITPGPFAPGLSRNEGTIPGIGVAMTLAGQSFDGSDGEQRPSIPGLPPGQPPLPPGPHPSLLGQQQQYQQIPQQQHPQFSQPPPPNMPQLQAPAHMLSHSQGSRPTLPQLPPMGGPSVPSQVNPPLPPMPHPTAMHGSQSQMMPQMPQHMMGLNQMHAGSVPPGTVPPMGGFPSGMGNIQGASGSSGVQNFPMGGMYNRPQGQMAPQGQMTSIPGLSSYQGMGNVGLTPPPPQHPPPRGGSATQ